MGTRQLERISQRQDTFATCEASTTAEYHKDRATAFERYINEVVACKAYNQTVQMFQQFHSAVLNPVAARDAALRDANRHYEAGFGFPDRDEWDLKNASSQLGEDPLSQT